MRFANGPWLRPFAHGEDLLLIPDLEDGVLPEGLHDCTIEHIADRFGQPQRSTVRVGLTATLRQLVKDAHDSGLVAAIIVDGSYVTAKAEPEDIDVIVVLRRDHDLQQELRPFEYNLLSKRRLRSTYKFDAFVALEGSAEYQAILEFFARVKSSQQGTVTSRSTKGLLRIAL